MFMRSFRPAGSSAGVLLYSLGVFLFALNDALGKWLVADYSVGQLLFLRTIGAALVLCPLLWRNRAALRVADQRKLHLARIVCMAADTYSFYFATKALPLADVMTFYLAAPLIITSLAVPLLGERVGLFRWGAVIVGFIGVVIALRPTGAAFSGSALIALFGASMFGLAVTITRKLRDTHWLTLVTWQFVGAGIIGAASAVPGWVQPSPADLMLMFLLGIVAMACFVCITKALSIAPASLLAPFQYVSIVWAVILGWLIWGDAPSASIVVGSAIIVASGLVVFYRERRRGSSVSDIVEPIP